MDLKSCLAKIINLEGYIMDGQTDEQSDFRVNFATEKPPWDLDSKSWLMLSIYHYWVRNITKFLLAKR